MATPIRIKRSTVPGKVPTVDQLQSGELAVNVYDGKVYIRQDTGGVGIATRTVQVGFGGSTGATLFVSENGNDENTGLTEGDAFATLQKAISFFDCNAVSLSRSSRNSRRTSPPPPRVDSCS